MYRLTCSRGHDRVELEGDAALDHAQACTGRKLGSVYDVHTGRDMIWRPRPSTARTPRAPRPGTGVLSEALTAALVASGGTAEYEVTM